LDYIQTVLDFLALAVCLVMAYSAIGVLLVMRKGLLERSWRNIAMGAIVIALGVVIFSIPTNSSTVNDILGYAGTSCQVIGGLFLIVGFREQHPKFMVRALSKKEEKEARPDLMSA
jgi:small neutral amino acid transporter SnatA (MarC family)